MSLPTINGVGRLTHDPELSFTPSGKPVTNVSLAFNSRRLNPQTNQWEDGDVFFVRGSVWQRQAENVAETLAKGMEVMVTGELRTESWEKDGQKHSTTKLLIRSIAPSLAFSVAKVSRDAQSQQGAESGGQGSGRGQQGQAQRSRPSSPPADDPWAVGAPKDSDEPPF